MCRAFTTLYFQRRALDTSIDPSARIKANWYNLFQSAIVGSLGRRDTDDVSWL